MAGPVYFSDSNLAVCHTRASARTAWPPIITGALKDPGILMAKMIAAT